VAEAGAASAAATVAAGGRSPVGTMTVATFISALCCLAMANSAKSSNARPLPRASRS